MKFPDDAPVTPAKRDALRERLAALNIDLAAIDEQAVKAAVRAGRSTTRRRVGFCCATRFRTSS